MNQASSACASGRGESNPLAGAGLPGLRRRRELSLGLEGICGVRHACRQKDAAFAAKRRDRVFAPKGRNHVIFGQNNAASFFSPQSN